MGNQTGSTWADIWAILNPALVWAGLALLALGGLLMLYRLTLGLGPFRAARTLCPGPRPSWLVRLLPWHYIHRHRCGFDLSATPADDDGSAVCTECGRRTTEKRRLRRVRAWRLANIAVVTVMLGAGSVAVPWTRSGGWIKAAPTPLLVAVHWVKPGHRPVAWELIDRHQNNTMMGFERRMYAASLVRDLRDDDIRWNAHNARRGLRQLGSDAVSPLTRALTSRDRQQRTYAARALIELQRQGVEIGEPEALIVAAVEMLADDRWDPDRQGYRSYNEWSTHTASSGEMYLLTVPPERLRPHLAEAMRSDDPQQRALAAMIAVRAGCGSLHEDAVPILIAGLGNNTVDMDASAGVLGLVAIGAPAVEPVRARLRDLAASGGVYEPLPAAESKGWTERRILRLGPGLEEPLTQEALVLLHVLHRIEPARYERVSLSGQAAELASGGYLSVRLVP